MSRSKFLGSFLEYSSYLVFLQKFQGHLKGGMGVLITCTKAFLLREDMDSIAGVRLEDILLVHWGEHLFAYGVLTLHLLPGHVYIWAFVVHVGSGH